MVSDTVNKTIKTPVHVPAHAHATHAHAHMHTHTCTLIQGAPITKNVQNKQEAISDSTLSVDDHFRI